MSKEYLLQNIYNIWGTHTFKSTLRYVKENETLSLEATRPHDKVLI